MSCISNEQLSSRSTRRVSQSNLGDAEGTLGSFHYTCSGCSCVSGEESMDLMQFVVDAVELLV